MQKYIEQFGEDIDNLLKSEPPYNGSDDFEFDEETMIKFEESFFGDEGIPVGEFTKISKEHLPPPRFLTDKQTSFLSERLIKLLQYYSFFPDFPEGLPDSIKYKTLREHWNKFKAPSIPFQLHYEFCEYDENKCPFQGFCSYCDEEKQDKDMFQELEKRDKVLKNILPTKDKPKD